MRTKDFTALTGKLLVVLSGYLNNETPDFVKTLIENFKKSIKTVNAAEDWQQLPRLFTTFEKGVVLYINQELHNIQEKFKADSDNSTLASKKTLFESVNAYTNLLGDLYYEFSLALPYFIEDILSKPIKNPNRKLLENLIELLDSIIPLQGEKEPFSAKLKLQEQIKILISVIFLKIVCIPAQDLFSHSAVKLLNRCILGARAFKKANANDHSKAPINLDIQLSKRNQKWSAEKRGATGATVTKPLPQITNKEEKQLKHINENLSEQHHFHPLLKEDFLESIHVNAKMRVSSKLLIEFFSPDYDVMDQHPTWINLANNLREFSKQVTSGSIAINFNGEFTYMPFLMKILHEFGHIAKNLEGITRVVSIPHSFVTSTEWTDLDELHVTLTSEESEYHIATAHGFSPRLPYSVINISLPVLMKSQPDIDNTGKLGKADDYPHFRLNEILNAAKERVSLALNQDFEKSVSEFLDKNPAVYSNYQHLRENLPQAASRIQVNRLFPRI